MKARQTILYQPTLLLLGLCGLEISTGLAAKSASLRKWVVNPLPHLDNWQW